MDEAFVYSWTNTENGHIYVGYHKGNLNDGYVSSSRNEKFWNDFAECKLTREILFSGSMTECIEFESTILKSLDVNRCYNRNINGKILMTDDVKNKIGDALRGRKQSADHVRARSESLMGRVGGFKGKSHSNATLEKMKEVKRSPEHKGAISNALSGRISPTKGLKQQLKLCPNCNRDIPVNTYARWHGDNCKEKQ